MRALRVVLDPPVLEQHLRLEQAVELLREPVALRVAELLAELPRLRGLGLSGVGFRSRADDRSGRRPPQGDEIGDFSPVTRLCHQKMSSARMSRGETLVLVMQPAQDRSTHDLALAPVR